MAKIPHFPYMGSKFGIRDWVASHMPRSGKTYIEPFVGRGNVFFLSRSILKFSEWHINDLKTIPFFNSIRQIDIESFPVEMDWELFKRYRANPGDPLAAVMEPAVAHMGHYKSGWAGRYTRTRKYDKTAYGKKIQAARELLNGVTTTDVTWEKLNLDQYGPDDFIYLDPPYMGTDIRHYRDEFNHKGLLETVRGLKSRWVLSHIAHPLYLSELGEPVAVRERQAAGKAVSRVRETISECLWCGS